MHTDKIVESQSRCNYSRIPLTRTPRGVDVKRLHLRHKTCAIHTVHLALNVVYRY